MIFDTKNINKFSMYKSKPGPFCLVFYQEQNDKNRELYIYLKSILKEFPYLPFLRFHFKDFQTSFPEEKISSPNQILIIGEGKESRIEDISDFSKIAVILDKVSIDFWENKKKHNIDYRRRKKLMIWAPNCHKFKESIFLKFDEEDGNSMYEFPNKTAQIPKPPRRNRLQIHPVPLSSPSKLKNNSKYHQKGVKTQNSLHRNVNIPAITQNKRMKTSQKISIKSMNACRLRQNISISPPNVSNKKFNYDEPLDLSLRKIKKLKNIKAVFLNPPYIQKFNFQRMIYNQHIETNESFHIYPYNSQNLIENPQKDNLIPIKKTVIK